MPVSLCFFLFLLIHGGTSFLINSYLRRHLPNRSQELANRTNTAETKEQTTPPLSNYMLNLYQNFNRMESSQSIDAGPTLLSGVPSSAQADIIRSLVAKSFDLGGSRLTLAFDFSSLNREEELLLAEIRFGLPAFKGLIAVGTEVTADVFHQPSTCQEINGFCQNYAYLGSFTGTFRSRSSEACLMLEATEIVHKWFERAESLKTNVQFHLKQPKKLPRAESAESRYQEHKSTDQQVLMFVYSNLSKEKLSVTATLLQDAAHSKYLAMMPVMQTISNSRRHRRSHIIKERIMGMKHVPSAERSRTLCRRVDFFVDFKQIGWDIWIIHPKKYNAYRCEGECPTPVNESVKPNNHAYMQSLMNYYVNGKAPGVCCVPIRMSSLSMIYYDHDDIAFQNHEGMIVDECGCQ